MRIKIVEPGWDKFTGLIGTIQFIDGVSTEAVSKADMDRLGAIMRVETVTGESVGAGMSVLQSKDANAPMLEALKTRPEEPPPPPPVVENTPHIVKPEIIEPVKGSDRPSVSAVKLEKIYTAEELGKIADEKGIEGLRVIAAPLGVKGRSIIDLIEGIQRVQEYIAKQSNVGDYS